MARQISFILALTGSGCSEGCVEKGSEDLLGSEGNSHIIK